MIRKFALFALVINLWSVFSQKEIARGVCRSVYYQYITKCTLPLALPSETLSIQVIRQISRNPCIQDNTYGLSLDNTYIWTSGLCQAEFSVQSVTRSSDNPIIATASAPAGTTERRQGTPGTSNNQCGVPNHYRVIGGTNSTACEYPWMVMVANLFSNVSCGGAILDSTHILTASHCFFSINRRSGTSVKAIPTQIAVLSGSSTMPFHAITIPGLRIRNVAKIITHENYDWKTLANDIAVIKLSEPIQYDSCHRPICLNNDSRHIQQTTNCRTMGWGVSSNQPGAVGQSTLQWINLPVVNDLTCRRKYRTYATSNTFCAGTTGKDTCKGDSGGPFVCSESDGRFYVYGIVSAGIDSQCGKSLGLYTKVSSYLPWIMKQLSE
ncbi:chymotrypsin-like protease CTRL-1 [Biomphalaria glabrata]|uniref:Chymotrypsin-like protease CTRL-1 n=1 Tax=Biomphalaria glabrata TaxID=6526 RepID=A0A9W3B0C1_BIOGL|nr:chymotrypsin-like protease CTRL-1 [Biomphalaria glabrata]